jgi:ACR3 family arsenite transporter
VALEKVTYANISFPIAILLWIMIYPMTLRVDFESLKYIKKQPRGLLITTIVNWAVQPFTMYALALLFFRVIYGKLLNKETQDQFIAGAVILGGSPCTAMVFVWSTLVNGNAAYTLVQVSVNDILLLGLYAPTLFLFLRASNIPIPYKTILLSVVLYVVTPFIAGFITRKCSSPKSLARLESALQPFTVIALLAALVLIFIYQGSTIVDDPVHILMVAVPITLQSYFIAALVFVWCWWYRVPFDVTAPACFIGCSNFFEMAVGVAISGAELIFLNTSTNSCVAVYGAAAAATLVCVVGVLIEVPVMLSLVYLAKRWKTSIEARAMLRVRSREHEPDE